MAKPPKLQAKLLRAFREAEVLKGTFLSETPVGWAATPSDFLSLKWIDVICLQFQAPIPLGLAEQLDNLSKLPLDSLYRPLLSLKSEEIGQQKNQRNAESAGGKRGMDFRSEEEVECRGFRGSPHQCAPLRVRLSKSPYTWQRHYLRGRR